MRGRENLKLEKITKIEPMKITKKELQPITRIERIRIKTGIGKH